MPTAAPTPPAPATKPIATAAEASTSSRTVTIPGLPEVGTKGACEPLVRVARRGPVARDWLVRHRLTIMFSRARV